MAQPASSTVTEATAPQSAPPASLSGYGASYSDFIWQQLATIQSTLGAIQESQRHIADRLQKLDGEVSAKLQKVEGELAELKQIRHTAKWLFYVAGVIGTVCFAVLGFIATEVWAISKPILLEKLHTPQTTATAPSGTPAVPVDPPKAIKKPAAP